MSLRDQLVASISMERQHNAHDEECAALAHLAHSESRWAVRNLRDGQPAEAAVYRSRARWHLMKARQKKILAEGLRSRKLRVVK